MSNGLQHLFLRDGITFKEVFIRKESEKVTKEMTAPWEETTLPKTLARYQLKDIFNADEFGSALRSTAIKIFALPRQTLFTWKTQQSAVNRDD